MLAKEADALKFMNAENNEVIEPAAIIDMLVDCGLLNRNQTNRHLQFAYDPVSENLAAYAIMKAQAHKGSPLLARVRSEPNWVLRMPWLRSNACGTRLARSLSRPKGRTNAALDRPRQDRVFGCPCLRAILDYQHSQSRVAFVEALHEAMTPPGGYSHSAG